MSDTHTHTVQDQIRADRACAGCGFNLYGQTITKEEHYGLAIARCPECGTVAALQQYPAMTHWVNRFRMIIGGLYVFILLATLGLSALGLSGFAVAATDIASGPLADHLGQQFTIWDQQQQAASNGQAGTAQNQIAQFTGSQRWTTLSTKWMNEELENALTGFGSLWSNADREALILVVPAGFVSLLIGMYWSIALLGASRIRALAVPAIAVLVGGGFVIALNVNPGGFLWAREVAESVYVTRIVPIVMGYEFIMMAIGVMVGRKVARFIVKLALPPRARVPLGILWSRDGLSMPKP